VTVTFRLGPLGRPAVHHCQHVRARACALRVCTYASVLMKPRPRECPRACATVTQLGQNCPVQTVRARIKRRVGRNSSDECSILDILGCLR
jgi:hypothetical protein